MQNLIKISNTEIQVKEYQGKRVCTLKDIDTVHRKAGEVANRNFNRNRKHFIQGEDFFRTDCQEAKELFNTIAPNGLILITESGYLMLVKSFTDDLAWDVQRQLVNNYFRKPVPKVPLASTPKPKTQKEILEDQYVGALRSADQCKNLKEYYLAECAKNEKDYHRFLILENSCRSSAEYVKAEIRKLDEQSIKALERKAAQQIVENV